MDTFTLDFRLVEKEDAQGILDIYAWYIQHTAFSFEYTVPSLEAYSDRILKYAKEAPWIVIEKNNKIFGFAYASPHRGRAAYQWNREVSIYLDNALHGSGVAKQLYSILLRLLKLQGYTNALAGVVSPNPKSEAFHQKMGFELVGTYHNIGYKHERWWNVNWFELFLQTPDYEPSKLLTMKELIEHPEYNDQFLV